MITWYDMEQGSKEWQLARMNRWTGTKAIYLLQGKPMPPDYNFKGNNATQRGHMLEVVAIREYERRYKCKVLRPGFITNSVYTNAGYSPDGIHGSSSKGYLLECKALNGKNHEDLIAGEIPLKFLVQIYFGMIITGYRKARLLAFNPEYETQLTVMDITYDKAIGNNIRKKLRLDMKNRKSI